MVQREEWGSWLQFLFSAVGSLVGLGNIWRFPYVCYRNGGGAFLIPFCVCMLVLGIPIGFLEILYCQYSSRGPGRVWIICPLFKGIWLGMMVMIFVVSLYYTMLMAWVLYYLCMSFSSSLPWSSCDHEWNSPNCLTLNSNTTDKLFNKTKDSTYISSTEDYWINKVLERTGGIDELGSFRWELILCLFASWLVVFLCLSKGVQAMGKIAYVAATLPYILLTILLIRGLLLPGAGDGIYYFFYPQWDKLLDYQVWRDAATQLFFSAGLGFGFFATLASYNKFNNNCFRDSILMPILDTVTSIFAGVIIFAYMGYMAHLADKDVDTVVQHGPGLVFIAYPTALDTLPLPQLWAVLFFLMLFCTGLDSQFTHIQALSTAVVDFLPSLLPKKTLVTGVLCLISFVLTLPLTTQGGIYVLNLVDWYIASISIMLIVLIEILVLAWIYGTDRLYDDIEQMIGYRVPAIYGIAWKYITPIFVFALWLAGIVGFQSIGAKNPGYHPWSDALGLLVAFLPILPIPVLAAWTLYTKEGTLKERIRESIKPTKQWGPAAENNADSTEMECMTNEYSHDKEKELELNGMA